MEHTPPNLSVPEESLDLTINAAQEHTHKEHIIVGRLLSSKRINYKAINVVLTGAWNLGQNVDIHSLDHNTILCSFKYEADKVKILHKGPWAVKGVTLNFIEWPSTLNLNELDFSKCCFWVQVHNAPPNRMNEENAIRIGRTISNVTSLDHTNPFGIAKKIFRIQVQVDTNNSLKTGCYMNREDGTKLWLPFRYERLSDFCYLCGKLDHTESSCTTKDREEADEADPRHHYGPWLRGQSLEPSRRLENSSSSPRKPTWPAARGHASVPTPAPSSSDPPPQDIHQNGNPLLPLPSKVPPFSCPLVPRRNPPPSPGVNALPLPESTIPPDTPQLPLSAPIIVPEWAPDLPHCGPQLLDPIAQPAIFKTHSLSSHIISASSGPDLLPQCSLSLTPTITGPTKRKDVSPELPLSKLTRMDYLESIHAAMARMGIEHQPPVGESPPHAPDGPDTEIREEQVTITCRRLIHVKRQARRTRHQQSELCMNSSSQLQEAAGVAGLNLPHPRP